MEIETTIAVIAAQLDQARSVLFITGAGISADSGLPTYRGVGGLYNDNATEDGLVIEEALSGDVFAMRPDITWKYLLQIEQNCRGAQPNAAHRFIAALEDRLSCVMVLTQNVDGLHRKAGSCNLIEIHGGLRKLHCTACDFEEIAEDYAGLPSQAPGRPKIDLAPVGGGSGRRPDPGAQLIMPLRCPQCQGILRPDIVLFGEQLPPGAIDRLLVAMNEGFDMVFIIGTSAVFPYISQPVIWAAGAGISTVEINPARTHLSDIVDYHLPLAAADAMTSIAARMTTRLSLAG